MNKHEKSANTVSMHAGEEKISSSYIRILDPVIPQTGLPQWLRGKESAWNAGYSGDSGLIPRLDDPLEEGMVTCSIILAWRIPRTEEPGWLQSIGLHRVRHDLSDSSHSTHFT